VWQKRRRSAIRALVALEDDHRAYRGVIAAAIRVLRPHAKAEPIEPEALAEEMERSKPQLVVCSRPNTMDPGGMPAWVELSLDHRRPTRVCIGGHYREYNAPLALETLLQIVDDAEQFGQTQDDCRGC
jgi:F420-dependent methylenetetrahydromethanopterin dehydrogenase